MLFGLSLLRAAVARPRQSERKACLRDCKGEDLGQYIAEVLVAAAVVGCVALRVSSAGAKGEAAV